MNILFLFCSQIFHIVDFAFVGKFKQQNADNQRKYLCDWESKPYLIEGTDAGNQPCSRKQDKQLTQNRDQKAVFAFANCLEEVGEGNTQSSSRETKADGAQSRDTNFHHFFACVKHHQKIFCTKLEDQEADNHDAQGDGGRKLECVHQTFFVAGTEVVSHNRHGAVSESEYRHKDEGLQFEVNAEDSNSSLREYDQDIV